MLQSIIKRISLDKDLEREINNFLIEVKEKKITSTQLIYIPPIIIPIPENHPIRKERGKETATHTETRGYFLSIVYYES